MGIEVLSVPKYTEEKGHDRYIINSLIVFLAVCGSISYILTALEIECYGFILYPVLLLICFGCAAVVKSKRRAVFGYLAIMFFFATYVLGCSEIINSGFNHFLNVLYQTVDKRYVLGIDKEYSEIIADSALSVTMLAVAIGFAMAIMVNMLVAESMNGFGVAFLESLFLAVPFYFGKEGNVISFLMVVAAPISVMVIKSTKKFGLYETKVSYNNKPPRYVFEMVARKVKPEPKKSFENKYTKKGYFKSRVMPRIVARQLGVVAVIAIVIGVAVVAVVPNYVTSGVVNPVESVLKVPVQQYAMYGFEGLWGRNNLTGGGMMDGSLNDTGFIGFDYRTDLLVKFVPTSYDRVLLRGYVGTYYTGKAWVNEGGKGAKSNVWSYHKFLDVNDYLESNAGFYANKASYQTAYDMNYLEENEGGLEENGLIKGRMTITNVGMREGNTFIPYYAYPVWDASDSRLERMIQSDNEVDADYSRLYDDEGDGNVDEYAKAKEPYTIVYYTTKDLRSYIEKNIASINKRNEDESDKENRTAYRNYVYSVYLDNSVISEYVGDEFIKMYGLKTIYDGQDKVSYYKKNGFDYNKEMAIVDKLQSIFDTDYTYTLVPGKTPADKDYAEYFLLTNKRGYCVHFATSAVMILRQLGVPARYCEGYALDPQTWTTSMDIEASGDGYYIQGDSDNIATTRRYDDNEVLPLVEADITDEYGHAWIEIYCDGIGWIPIDITPASDEEEEDVQQNNQPAILAAISGLAGGAANMGRGIAGLFGIVADNKVAIAIGIGCVVTGVVLGWILSILLATDHKRRKMQGQDADAAIRTMAVYAARLLRFNGFDKAGIMTFGECATYAYNQGDIELADAIMIIEPMQSIVYGGYHVDEQQRAKAYEGIKSLSGCIYRKLKWYKKIKFFIVKRLMVIR